MPILPPYPRKRHSKKLYPAGLFSLALLPVIFYWLLSSNGLFVDERVLEISTWHSYHSYPEVQDSSDYKLIQNKKSLTVYLTTNVKNNSVKINLAKEYLDKLHTIADTNHTVHFILDESMPYQSYINMFDAISMHQEFEYNTPLRTYMYAGQRDLWAFTIIVPPLPPDTTQVESWCGTDFSCGTQYFKKKETPTFATIYIKPYWYIYMLIVAMLFSFISDLFRNKKPLHITGGRVLHYK
jgi:hypothetical protein